MTDSIIITTANGQSRVYTGSCLHLLPSLLSGRKVFVITDNNVSHHLSAHFPDAPVLIIKSGESSKNWKTLAEAGRWLLDQGADRSAFILGFGGGMVCDLAGFLASIYMRGIGFGFVSTTLLSQTDASVGGKNGINLDGYKNILGVFNQPEFVLCDPILLETLPDKEWRNGLAEVVKHALIADQAMFDLMEQNINRILLRDHAFAAYMVNRSVEIKSHIVREDEREHGMRRKLNLGHTLGHAVERATGMHVRILGVLPFLPRGGGAVASRPRTESFAEGALLVPQAARPLVR